MARAAKKKLTTEAKHTPGPWRVTDSSGVADEDDTLLAECHQGIRRGADEAHANAVLIAASPDMLDALALAVSTIEQLIPEPSARGVVDVVLFAARAAIAKAEGR